MQTFIFTHYYEVPVPEYKGPPSSWADAYVERLGEMAGGPDFSVVTGRPGVLIIQFAREAPSAALAYWSSVKDVLELLPGAIPIRCPGPNWWPKVQEPPPANCEHCEKPLEWWPEWEVWICPCKSVPTEKTEPTGGPRLNAGEVLLLHEAWTKGPVALESGTFDVPAKVVDFCRKVFGPRPAAAIRAASQLRMEKTES